MITKLTKQINTYFVGKEKVVENVMVCLLAGGHVLLEDVPGVGKTTLVRALAASIDASSKRISFTPDTLPTDLTGLSIYNMKTGEFEYKEGAVMANFVLGDEINRTSPRTQSSLLEVMAEGQVTVDGTQYLLPQPYMVIATQNPVEFIGTYPLPEAQMDRFMMRLSIGYPDKENEILMTRQELAGKGVTSMQPVCTAADVLAMKEEVKKVQISDAVLSYVRDMIELTRQEKRYVLGASPRAMIALSKAAQAKAYMDGRDYVKPDDVKNVAFQVLSHRLTLTTDAKISKEDPKKVLNSIIIATKVPME